MVASEADLPRAASELAPVLQRSSVIVQPYLHGVPFTLYALTDGARSYVFPPVRSYPWRLERDAGPHTGGMGSIMAVPGPLPHVAAADPRPAEEAIKAVLARLADLGRPYASVLAGEFLHTSEGSQFIEFDCRFGDPEVINCLYALRTPLGDIIEATLVGDLPPPELRSGTSTAVVLVPERYPHAVPGTNVTVLVAELEAAGLDVFYGNLEERGARWFSGTSRTLTVAAHADTLAQAVGRTDVLAELELSGLAWRTDIGRLDA